MCISYALTNEASVNNGEKISLSAYIVKSLTENDGTNNGVVMFVLLMTRVFVNFFKLLNKNLLSKQDGQKPHAILLLFSQLYVR